MLTTIEQRLARVERSLLLWRRGCMVAIVAVVLAASLGAVEARHVARFDAISCRALFLLNDRGEQVGAFQAGPQRVLLTVGDTDKQHATLSAAADGSDSGLHFGRGTDLGMALGYHDRSASLFMGNPMTDPFPIALIAGKTGGEIDIGPGNDLLAKLMGRSYGGALSVRSPDGRGTLVLGTGIVAREPENAATTQPASGR